VKVIELARNDALVRHACVRTVTRVSRSVMRRARDTSGRNF